MLEGDLDFVPHTNNKNMGVKHGSKPVGDDVTTLWTLGSIAEMDGSSCGSLKGLNNARKLHPSYSSKGFVEQESSMEVN